MNKLSSLGERIKKIRENMKLNQVDFAKRIGLDTATGVSNYEKNKRNPDINTLIKIAELGGVNLDWLLIGEASKRFFEEPRFEIATLIKDVRQELGLNRAAFGKKFGVDPDFITELETAGERPLYKEGEDVRVKNGKWVGGVAEQPQYITEKYPSYDQVKDKLAPIPVYAWTAAGPAMNLTEAEPIEILAIPIELIRPNMVAIKVYGTSMEPYIKDGAIVGIDLDNNQLTDGGIYVLYIPDEGVTMKRIFLHPEKLILKADNPLYPEMSLTPEVIKERKVVLGRIIWVFQRC